MREASDVPRRRAAPLLLLVVVVIACAILAQTAGGQSVLRRAGLMPGKEKYTALAFENARALPADLRGHPRLRLGFTVRNAEGGPRQYQWKVVALGPWGTRTLSAGQARARVGETVHTRTRVRIPCTGARVRVNVNLVAPAESIGFWTRCSPLPGQGLSGG